MVEFRDGGKLAGAEGPRPASVQACGAGDVDEEDDDDDFVVGKALCL